MRLLLLLLVAASIAPAVERVLYTKSFPGSVPAYVSISVDSQGAAEYREAADDDRPVRFSVNPREAQTIFDLAAKLNFFKDTLESPAKVARMGLKTLRFEKDATAQQTQFNYTDNPDARLLADWFERVSETEQQRERLERAARYDKLGVNQALLEVQSGWERKRLVAPEQLLPLLDRVANNETYVHMARTRAAALAGQIRAAETAPTP